MDERHVFFLPRQFAVRALQLNGPQVHSDHFVDVERTAFAEIRKGINPKSILRFLSDPVTDAKYSQNPYLKEYEAASLNPRNRSATAIRFFPASWSSSKKRYPSAQATFIKVRPSVTNVPGAGNRSSGQFST